MIPEFPQFKKLELTDKSDVEKFTSSHDPYSDFNFIEMWSWNLNDAMEISQLNGNLVIQPNDYFTDNYSLSYLGNSNLADTLEKLFAYMTLEGVENPMLKFVPEVSLHGIDLDKYLIEIDIDNCDYVYDLEKLSTYEGREYADKRRKINGFSKRHTSVVIRQLNLSSNEVINQIEKLAHSWEEKRNILDGGAKSKEEYALDRFLHLSEPDLICMAAYDGDNLVGFSTYSVLNHQYAICHFAKADVSYYGIYEFLMKESAKVLIQKECRYLNYQEDLGVPGLRFFKSSLKPTAFLRKYSVRLR